MDELDLIRRIRQGDLRAFDPLYERYARGLGAFALRIVGDRAAAEDVVHEAFVRVIQNLDLELTRARFATWLYRVTRNLALNHVRDRRARPAPAGLAGAVAGPADQVEQAELLNGLLAGLSAEHREVFLLKEREGFSYAEIAEILECPVGTIRSRLHYAVQALRRAVRERADELP